MAWPDSPVLISWNKESIFAIWLYTFLILNNSKEESLQSRCRERNRERERCVVEVIWGDSALSTFLMKQMRKLSLGAFKELAWDHIPNWSSQSQNQRSVLGPCSSKTIAEEKWEKAGKNSESIACFCRFTWLDISVHHCDFQVKARVHVMRFQKWRKNAMYFGKISNKNGWHKNNVKF